MNLSLNLGRSSGLEDFRKFAIAVQHHEVVHARAALSHNFVMLEGWLGRILIRPCTIESHNGADNFTCRLPVVMAVRLVQFLDALVILVSNCCNVELDELRLAVCWRQTGKVCQPGPHIYVHGRVLGCSKLGAVVRVHLLLKLDGAAA